MEINITKFEDYRDIIESLKNHRAVTSKKLAQACIIHTSYFSRVMVGKADFSSEQLYLIGKSLKLRDWEMEYLLVVGEYQSSGNVAHKNYLGTKIEAIQKKRQKITAQMSAHIKELSEHQIGLYYEEAVTAKIHMYLTLKRYRSSPLLICKKILISEKKLQMEFRKLEFLKIIERKGDKIKVLRTHVHLDESHPSSAANHINWRLETVNQIAKREADPSDYHLSVVFSSNQRVKKKVKDMIKDTILKAQKEVSLVPPDRDDEIYHLGIDLY